MIGDGWNDEPSVRPGEPAPTLQRPRRCAVVTGSRADFGLLDPVMRAIAERADLELLVIAAGSHLILPALTFRDVKARFEVTDTIPMQVAGRTGRFADVEATSAGVARFGRSFEMRRPDWVVVLGDRIEAFASATAASIGGIAVCHLHGGDRAEGVADEAMRHAITKLAHLHLPATERSAQRIRAMGERPEHVRVIGSPALDDLGAIPALDDDLFEAMGSPRALLLMHPVGRHDEEEEFGAAQALAGIAATIDGPVLALHPNHDPGRNGVLRAIAQSGVRDMQHLPRARFVGLLKRLASTGGVLVGNSSCALIEASALGLPAVDIGPRQSGRERGSNIVRCEQGGADAVAKAIDEALAMDRAAITHPYGDGASGPRAAHELARIDPGSPSLLRKRFVDPA